MISKNFEMRQNHLNFQKVVRKSQLNQSLVCLIVEVMKMYYTIKLIYRQEVVSKKFRGFTRQG